MLDEGCPHEVQRLHLHPDETHTTLLMRMHLYYVSMLCHAQHG